MLKRIKFNTSYSMGDYKNLGREYLVNFLVNTQIQRCFQNTNINYRDILNIT